MQLKQSVASEPLHVKQEVEQFKHSSSAVSNFLYYPLI